MKRIFVLLLSVLFVVSFVYAERGNGSGNDNECTIDSDCGVDEICVAGECEDVRDSGNDECTTDTECAPGKICLNGECEDLDNENENESEDDVCVIDSDCGVDEICVAGECEDINDSNKDTDDTDDMNNNINNASDNKTRWIKDCIDDSVLRNMNELELKIKRVEKAGETVKMEELKNKMRELALKVREKTEECKRLRMLNRGALISEAAKLKEGGAAEIVDYYKTKLSEIYLEEDDVQRLEMLKALRSEIDKEIKTIMESKEKIRGDEIDELVEKIEVRSDKIRADDVEVDSENKSIIKEIGGKEVEIKVINGQVKIEVDGVEVDTGAITIENDTLFYNGVAIRTLPSDALVRYKLKVKEMKLEQEREKLVYKVKYEESRKIFGLFKAKAEREAEIDADDGNKLNDKGPWWQWMSTRDARADKDAETELEIGAETTE